MQKTFYMNTNLKAYSTRLININLIWRKRIVSRSRNNFSGSCDTRPPQKNLSVLETTPFLQIKLMLFPNLCIACCLFLVVCCLLFAVCQFAVCCFLCHSVFSFLFISFFWKVFLFSSYLFAHPSHPHSVLYICFIHWGSFLFPSPSSIVPPPFVSFFSFSLFSFFFFFFLAPFFSSTILPWSHSAIPYFFYRHSSLPWSLSICFPQSFNKSWHDSLQYNPPEIQKIWKMSSYINGNRLFFYSNLSHHIPPLLQYPTLEAILSYSFQNPHIILTESFHNPSIFLA